ncbi:hypothetical protein DSM104299_04249 [Baekduia alba]|uniref:hypothetical protein n=1 Tax=Baekduia alba TaxID=2997333 RepID=UPI0023408CAC|nr:hypothetical protein [Baekduia alba]WCB95501.1 hypothetical protein DSM104299_04249 [Baekduia alba]
MTTLNDTEAVAALMGLLSRRVNVNVGGPGDEAMVLGFTGTLGVLASGDDQLVLGLDAATGVVVVPTSAAAVVGDGEIVFAFSGVRVRISERED